MINSMTGERTTLTVEERIQILTTLYEIYQKNDLKVLLKLGGTDLPELYLIAEQAEKLKIDAIIVS